jgi:hypothetical protein
MLNARERADRQGISSFIVTYLPSSRLGVTGQGGVRKHIPILSPLPPLRGRGRGDSFVSPPLAVIMSQVFYGEANMALQMYLF